MDDLLAEATSLPADSVDRARAIAWIKPPDDLAGLVPRVRREHAGALSALHAAIRDRFESFSIGHEINAFYAASELALIALVWRRELEPSDRSHLRAPWDHLRGV